MGTAKHQAPHMRLVITTILILCSITAADDFRDKRQANSVLKAKKATISQREWNNELIYNLQLWNHEDWSKFIRGVPKRGNKPLHACAKGCKGKDKNGWRCKTFNACKFNGIYEDWKETGFDADKKPQFPCKQCLSKLATAGAGRRKKK